MSSPTSNPHTFLPIFSVKQTKALPDTKTSLSLNENLRVKEVEKEKTGETRFASLLSAFHGLLRLVTSHSRYARL